MRRTYLPGLIKSLNYHFLSLFPRQYDGNIKHSNCEFLDLIVCFLFKLSQFRPRSIHFNRFKSRKTDRANSVIVNIFGPAMEMKLRAKSILHRLWLFPVPTFFFLAHVWLRLAVVSFLCCVVLAAESRNFAHSHIRLAHIPHMGRMCTRSTRNVLSYALHTKPIWTRKELGEETKRKCQGTSERTGERKKQK